MSYYIVGVTETCKRLAVCATQKQAEQYCGTLPNAEHGLYYIDGPVSDTIMLAGLTVSDYHIEEDDDDDDTTYRIVRFCFNSEHDDHHKVIATGLSLDEAQDHCNDEATHGEDSERGMWFDGYSAE